MKCKMEKKGICIEYCTKCGWMLRAAWMAQELLTTFAADIESVTLKPGSPGTFKISTTPDGVELQFESGKFPEIKELKQVVRDHVAPGKSLGHSDRKPVSQPTEAQSAPGGSA